MIIEKIGEGVSFEAAVEDAKLKLMAPDDAELHFETIRESKKKLFGLKIEPAQVKVWYEVPDPKPAKEKKPAEKKFNADKKPIDKKADKKDAVKPAKQEAPKAKAVKETDEATEKKAAPVIAKTAVSVDENDTTVKYLKMIVAGMGIDTCDVTLEQVDGTDEFIYTVDCGESDGALIGRRGETLDAIQYLVRLSVNKGIDDDKHRKISVNVGNYREKRNDNLRALAAKSARQVLNYGRNIALEPMNPYERRIIHTAIQEIEGVTSHSVGSDSNRKVIITLEDGVEPLKPSRGGYGRRDGGRRDGGRGGRGGRGGYQKKEAYKPAVTREPRKDAAGSLYGKIEIPSNNDAE